MSATAPWRGARRPGATHPFCPGEAAFVLALRDDTGRPFLEGRATIVAAAVGPHRYLVKFDGAPSTTIHERFVHPEYQHDPEGCLAWMVAFWAATRAPETTDFFPESSGPSPREV